MLPKPDACRGCPAYGTGQGFVPDVIREGTPVLIVGQNPGSQEEAQGRPFVGKTGEMLERDFLPLSGFTREGVSLANALRCRWKGSNELPPLHHTDIRVAIERCTVAHFRLPAGVRLIVVLGQYALWAMTGEGLEPNRSIMGWRGYLLPFNPAPRPSMIDNAVWTPGPNDLPVLATLHLALLFKGLGRHGGGDHTHIPSMRVPMRRDWSKIPLVLAGTWPQPLPEPRRHWPFGLPAGLSAFDTEFDPADPARLLRYSLAHVGSNGQPTVWVVEANEMAPLALSTAPSTVVMHNAPADLSHLASQVTPMPDLLKRIRVEDTMYAHSVLWSDLPHDLDFLGSLYARTNRWKHLRLTNQVLYAAGDALGTLDTWLALEREFERDPDSYRVYTEYVRPQIGVIWQATSRGLRVNRELAREFLEDLERRAANAQAYAEALVGFPINLNSPQQVSHYIYGVERIMLRGPRHLR